MIVQIAVCRRYHNIALDIAETDIVIRGEEEEEEYVQMNELEQCTAEGDPTYMEVVEGGGISVLQLKDNEAYSYMKETLK
jgi:hypothetical protein